MKRLAVFFTLLIFASPLVGRAQSASPKSPSEPMWELAIMGKSSGGCFTAKTQGGVDLLVSVACSGGSHSSLRATATAHSLGFTWTPSPTASTTTNIYCGPTSGAESTSPINSTPIANGTATYTWTGVTAGSTYFCDAAACLGATCSAPSGESSATVPIVSGDIAPPTNLKAVGN